MTDTVVTVTPPTLQPTKEDENNSAFIVFAIIAPSLGKFGEEIIKTFGRAETHNTQRKNCFLFVTAAVLIVRLSGPVLIPLPPNL